METIKLSEIPLPSQSDGTVAINIIDTVIRSEVFKKCEELGWMWITGMSPTSVISDKIFDWLGLGHIKPGNRKDRLYSSPDSKEWSKLYTIATDQETSVKFLDKTILKTSNTRPQATHCAKCHGRLKDPGMGPLYKHCPKCEP